MRFYFQDAGQKIATKCIRVSSTASTQDVINILIEKFRPDIRMLSIPEYALYETYENGEERKLGENERPLLVQLDWHRDDREGRFLLRRMDEKSYLPGFDPAQSNFKRKLPKREKKEKKRAEKEMKLQNKHQQQQTGSRENDATIGNNNNNKSSSSTATTTGTKVAEKLYTEVPENSFTRSISNPEAVMRRRRKQKLEKKLQQLCQDGGPEAGGTLRIFGETLNEDVPYKTLLLSTQDTAAYVVREILNKYGREKEDHNNYCLVQIIIPNNSQQMLHPAPLDPNANPSDIREYILDDDDCPLAIEKQHIRSHGSLSFHVKRRPADYQPRKKKKKPLHLKPEFEVNSEEILQRLHSLQPTTNNHHHHNQLPQQYSSTSSAGSNNNNNNHLQQNPDSMPISSENSAVQKYMNEGTEHRSVSSTASSQQDGISHSSATASASLFQQHPVPGTSHNNGNLIQQPLSAASLSEGPHFFPNSTTTDSQQHLHHSLQQAVLQQQQQQDRRSGSDQGHENTAGVVMNGAATAVAAGQQLLPKRQNTGPEVVVIMFKKGNGGMGLSIVATQGLGQQKMGIYIKNVVPGGAADQVHTSQPSEHIFSLPSSRFSLDDCCFILKYIPPIYFFSLSQDTRNPDHGSLIMRFPDIYIMSAPF